MLFRSIVLSYFMHRDQYKPGAKVQLKQIEWGSVIGVIAGAVVANLLPAGPQWPLWRWREAASVPEKG